VDNKIQSTLETVKSVLNQALANDYPYQSQPWVVLDSLYDAANNYNTGTDGRVVMSLTNIQHETIASTYNSTKSLPEGDYAVVPPPLYLDLFVIFVANFDDYSESLDAISRTISFFQQNPSFSRFTMPGLDPTIDKLTFEMVNLDLHELYNLVGLAGIHYLPLVLYKIRMLPFTAEMTAVVPEVGSLREDSDLEQQDRDRPARDQSTT